MYNIKGIGKYKELPELAMLIYEGQLQQLRDAWAAGEHTDVNRPFERIGLTPLELALIMCQSGMVQALLEQGAELNDRQHPSMLTAVEYASEQDIRRLYAAGAKMELRNHLNSNVYDRAYYGKKQHIPLIHELGFDICEHAYHVGRIEFFKLIDTIEMKIGRTRLLRLSAQVDPYGDLYIVWHPASRRIGAYDVEHQEYHSLANWNDFIANPLVALEQVW